MFNIINRTLYMIIYYVILFHLNEIWKLEIEITVIQSEIPVTVHTI
jgi:hypothetical protein